MDTIKVDDNEASLLYTAQEVAKGVTIKEEDEADVTTDLEVSSCDCFDPNNEDDKSDFDDNMDSDEDTNDENM